MFNWSDWCGYAGVGLNLLAFLLLQAEKIRGTSLVYQAMNIIGSLGIILSLVFSTFNLSAFLQEVVWIAISVYGIIAVQQRRRHHVVHPSL